MRLPGEFVGGQVISFGMGGSGSLMSVCGKVM
jgi:hypothetical protein